MLQYPLHPIRHCSSLILFLQACLAFNVGFYLGSYPHVCGELGTECLYITGKVSKLVPITAWSTMTSERLGVWAVSFCKLSENSIDFIMHIILNHEDLKLTPSYKTDLGRFHIPVIVLYNVHC